MGARDFSCAVSGFGRVFGRRPKTCRPAADEAPRHTREQISGTQGNNRENKSLCHVAMVAKFLDDNKSKTSVKN